MPTSAPPASAFDESQPLIPHKDAKAALNADRSSVFSVSEDNGSSYSMIDPARRRRLMRTKQVARFASLVFATIAALCAGSISTFSLYAPKFQSRLRYTQFQVNGVAIGSSVALYLPVSAMGLVCDRIGVPPTSFLSAFLFAGGYGLAAAIYKKLDDEYNTAPGQALPWESSQDANDSWSYPLMIFAFVMIGAGTCSMYIASLSTCAKNFGKGRFRGLALAMPIAGFGLSGMWLSQVGSRVFYEENPDGSRDVNVFQFFIFLAVLLFFIGIIGIFLLRVIDEQDLIEEAIEELEQSGLLDPNSPLARPGEHQYGSTTLAHDSGVNERRDEEDGRPQLKKSYLLNAETRRFLLDRTMWPFALAFFLMIGPGEAFVNNLGTVIGTLTPPMAEGFGNKTSVATHVSIFGITSTLSRLLIGTLTDILAPSPETSTAQFSAPSHAPFSEPQKRFTISRVAFLLFFASLLAIGLLLLASGAAQNHADRFWIVSGLVGAGYGALFSLTPIIVTIIWGVENFATNYGLIAMLPALGSTFWGLVYSAVYESGTMHQPGPDGSPSHDAFCHGQQCYASAFWAEGLSVIAACFLLFWVWKGKGGWSQRGIVI